MPGNVALLQYALFCVRDTIRGDTNVEVEVPGPCWRPFSLTLFPPTDSESFAYFSGELAL